MTAYIGKPIPRADGRAKVTGQARYAAEVHAPGLVYGHVVSCPIARGHILRIDARAALALPGVLQVFTHENLPRLAWLSRSYRDGTAPPGTPFRPLHGDKILFCGQPVALVVAESLELARYAASRVEVEYAVEPHTTELGAQRDAAYEPPRGKMGYEPPPAPRGHAERALKEAAVRIAADYFQPAEHHNPMEPHAATVLVDEDGSLVIYEKTQSVSNTKEYVCKVFGLDKDKVRVLSPFVGGAFGSGLRPQYQLFLAVLAARELGRSVRVELTRRQMFSFGYRPITEQRVELGAAADGALTAVCHSALANTSRFESFCEHIVHESSVMYRCENTRLDYKIAPLDLYTPIDMRAPGAVTGLFALECALDELAYAVGVDPLELRIKNYTERDQDKDRPFSSKELLACYQKGAERFGWARRPLAPRSLRTGDRLCGWGVAGGVWDAQQAPSSARAVLTADGHLRVSSATSDIGPGTYTIMTQLAAEALGLPLADVTFVLGDTSLPMAVVQGGSLTASSVGSAVQAVCEKLRARLLKLAQEGEGSPLAGAGPKDVRFVDGRIELVADPGRALELREVLRRAQLGMLEEESVAVPNLAKQGRYKMSSHSAVFAEVTVDEPLGLITVTRVVSAVAAGRILNPATARSQILGAVVMGLGMALTEQSVLDPRLGRFVNQDLAEYHVPVCADIRDLEVIFVEEHDDVVNPLGVKGVGEIGIVGVAAAIANAVFHATSRRVRSLPITLDKLL
ncbi:MAG: xanthine dehydrogenase family protein molybdopterin-binding subunit [Polyangia bacterium]